MKFPVYVTVYPKSIRMWSIILHFLILNSHFRIPEFSKDFHFILLKISGILGDFSFSTHIILILSLKFSIINFECSYKSTTSLNFGKKDRNLKSLTDSKRLIFIDIANLRRNMKNNCIVRKFEIFFWTL